MERPEVDKIEGLSPVIAIEQKTVNKSPRSTVGLLRKFMIFKLLYSRCSEAYSYVTDKKMISYTSEQILDLIETIYLDKKIILLSPVIKSRKEIIRIYFSKQSKKVLLSVE